MAHSWMMTLNLISIAAMTVAAILLYWASLSVPRKIQSWTGETLIEKRYERTRHIMARIGIPCVLIAAGCQTAVVLFS